MMDVQETLQARAQHLEGWARAEMLYQAGFAAEVRGHDLGQALSLYQQALSAHSEHAPAREALLALLELPGAGLALSLEPEEVEALPLEVRLDAWCARAEQLMAQEQPERARVELEQALEADPGHRNARLLSAEANASLRDWRGAAQCARLETQVSLDEASLAACHRLEGILLAELLDAPQEAAASLEKARAWMPTCALNEGSLWRLWLRRGDAGALSQHWRRAADKLPDGDERLVATVEAAAPLGLREEARGEALALLLEATRESQASAPLRRAALELAVALGARGRRVEEEQEALRLLALALESASRRATIYTRLGQRMLSGLDELDGIEAEKAVRYLEAAVDAVPGYLPALESLEVCYEEGAASRQGRDLLRARGEEEGRVDWVVRAARMSLASLQRPQEAWALLRRAVAMADEAELLGPGSPLELLEELPPEAGDPLLLLEEALPGAVSAAGHQLLLERLARLALQQGQDRVAMQALVRLVELLPEERFYVEILASLYHKIGALEPLEAMRRGELGHAEGRDPERALESMLALARLAQLAGDNEQALRWYRAVLERQPDELAAVVGAGRVLVRQERWAELALVFEAELAVAHEDPLIASMAFRCATLYERQLNDLERAWDSYARVRQINPHHLPSLLGMVRIASLRQDWSRWAMLITEWAERERDESLSGTLCCELAQVQEEHLEDLEAAAASYRKALERAPHLELARLGLIRCLFRLERSHEAALVMMQSLEENHAPVDRLDVLANAALMEQEEQTGLERLLVSFPEHAPSLMSAVRVALSQQQLHRAAAFSRQLGDVLLPGSLQEAWKRLADLIQRPPAPQDITARAPGEQDDEIRWVRYEAALRQAGELEVLAQVLRRRAHHSQEPAHKAAWLTSAARCLQQRGDLEQARGLHEEALELYPLCLVALKALRLLLEESGDREALALICEREGHMTQDPEHALEDLLRAAEIRRRLLNDLDGAAVDLEAVLARRPDHQRAFDSLREIYSIRNDHGPLCDLLERRVEVLRDPELARRLLMVCGQVALDRLQDRERAVRVYRRVLDFDPGYVQAWRILAQLAHEDGRWRDATRALTRVLHLTDDESLLARIHEDIARIQEMKLGDTAGAIASYRSLLRYDPDRATALRRLGELLSGVEQWEDAARAYGKLLQREKDRKRLTSDLMALAQICTHGLKDHDRAEQCLTQALRLDGLNLELHQALLEHLDRLGLAERRAKHLVLASRQFASALLRDAARQPQRDEALAALLQIATWQRDADRAYVVGAVARTLQASTPALEAAYQAGAQRAQPATPAVIPVDKTDGALPSELHLSFLKVLRFGDEALRRMHRPTWARDLNLGRRTLLRERDSRPGARVALAWPALFSLAELPVHVISADLETPQVLGWEEFSLILTEAHLAQLGRGDAKALFHLGLALAPLSMGVLGYASLPQDQRLAALAALVRRVSADWLQPELATRHPEVSMERIHKWLPRKGESAFMPHALDVSGRLDAEGAAHQDRLLRRACARLASVPVYRVGELLEHLAATRGQEEALDLARFLVGDRAGELRSAVLGL